jgi:glutamine synthetase type III
MGMGSKTDLLPKIEIIINYSFRAIVTNLKTIIVMKKSKFTEAQIVYALKQAETGSSVDEVCSKMSLSDQHTIAS